MLNLHRLFLLHELRRLQTMTAVANAHSMSASAVSQQLAQLERETKVSLFAQVGRRVVLTDAGVQLARRAEEMLGLLETAEAELALAQGEASGLLRVASFQTPMIALAPAAVSVLAERSPDLQVEMAQQEVDHAYEGLLAHDYDVILGEDYPGGEHRVRRGTDREALLRDPLLLVLPRSGPWAEVSTLSALADAPWALDPYGSRTGTWARTYLRQAGIEPHVRFATPDPLLQVHLVRTGHAVAFVPGLIASEHLGGTRVLRLPGQPRRSLYTAARAGAARHPSLLAFRAALLEAAGTLTALEDLDSLDA
ncbi:transcriptional regulator [Brachybacterium faecium DSM 4810]|uniref:Transcriptional regulator n=1 Tax=Brachybacterium faecium (strain ATCC 43885 / DSM 4810 / JCM 11609 / LMG 19847 / NBRC 14762 / NCIMB 9860 / 6-10) TaxID=446465 RepID=C7MD83_BRAFD|nr:LysR family transcriptional regulator [Brachybacterium faecium]ACU85540.1 transcriptional regulator [Brachybacterium faecium DSM 4810]HJG52062.1 LysR family transcriptional regulator [Brachybacterium faecium]